MKIYYRHMMIDYVGDCTDIHLMEIPLDRVPGNILSIIRTHEAFRESASYGAQGLGEPQE